MIPRTSAPEKGRLAARAPPASESSLRDSHCGSSGKSTRPSPSLSIPSEHSGLDWLEAGLI